MCEQQMRGIILHILVFGEVLFLRMVHRISTQNRWENMYHVHVHTHVVHYLALLLNPVEYLLGCLSAGSAGELQDPGALVVHVTVFQFWTRRCSWGVAFAWDVYFGRHFLFSFSDTVQGISLCADMLLWEGHPLIASWYGPHTWNEYDPVDDPLSGQRIWLLMVGNGHGRGSWLHGMLG